MQKHNRHHGRKRTQQASKRQRDIQRSTVVITVAGEHYAPLPIELTAVDERIATAQERAIASRATW